MPARDWGKDARRRARNEVIRDKALASADELSWRVEILDESEVLDRRPRCIVCTAPVTPEGDQAHQLSTGSWVHPLCIKGDDEQARETVPESFPSGADSKDDSDLTVYEIEVEFTRYLRVQVAAKPGEDPRVLLAQGERLEDEIDNVSVVVTRIDS